MNSSVHRPEGERLQKVLAAAGVGSRRECEELILTGRVDVDGVIVDELGVRVEPDSQTIRCDGQKLSIARPSYWLLNKPVGVLCTNQDPSGRTKVIDLIPSDQRLFTVGRLDRNSSGLILITNDGEFANQLAHPRFGVDKTYLVTVAGKPHFRELEVLTAGVRLAEGVAKVESVRIKKRRPMSTELEIVLREGKNREIRRILAKLGYKVLKLHRIAISTLRLADLPTGECRRLTPQELKRLKKMISGKTTSRRKKSAGREQKSRGDRTSQAPAAKGKSRRPKPLPQTQRQGLVLGADDLTETDEATAASKKQATGGRRQAKHTKPSGGRKRATHAPKPRGGKTKKSQRAPRKKRS